MLSLLGLSGLIAARGYGGPARPSCGKAGSDWWTRPQPQLQAYSYVNLLEWLRPYLDDAARVKTGAAGTRTSITVAPVRLALATNVERAVILAGTSSAEPNRTVGPPEPDSRSSTSPPATNESPLTRPRRSDGMAAATSTAARAAGPASWPGAGAGSPPAITTRPGCGWALPCSTRPVASTRENVFWGPARTAIAVRSRTVRVTVPGHRLETVVAATHGSRSTRRAMLWPSTSIMNRRRFSPAAATTSAGAVRLAPRTVTWSTSSRADRVAATPTPARLATVTQAKITRSRRRPSSRLTSIRRCRIRGSIFGRFAADVELATTVNLHSRSRVRESRRF